VGVAVIKCYSGKEKHAGGLGQEGGKPSLSLLKRLGGEIHLLGRVTRGKEKIKTLGGKLLTWGDLPFFQMMEKTRGKKGAEKQKFKRSMMASSKGLS